ncbi:uncharacterized protein BHQ10_006237 [Talaromyces amestolkiae]|uniref:CN hydrolase domain-containing protein n=1 Tax=Talaromyces amestolkiae TaxID=1196081 RepID=A0A364L345_TALAM|nr:uncharacterized protein BHQ10_006237 [Talaromyces amestolkiae]RAO70225.1 hypothetical protein BHQ10_006237 [Talaromyces amestolkiae]
MRFLLGMAVSLAGVVVSVRACASHTDASNFTIAMVRTYPPNWPLPLLSSNWTGITMNISQAVDKAVDLIQEASHENASLVLFPELWFPGYPMGFGDDTNWPTVLLPEYIENCLTVGDGNWARIVDSVVDTGVYVGLGFCDKTTENIFMGQALISPSGDVLIHRHKLRPSGSERDMFSDGTMEMLEVTTTRYGRIGMLECYEHFWPSMTLPMQAQLENIHLAAFPYLVDDSNPQKQWYEGTFVNMAAETHYAVLSGAYVFHTSVGTSWVISPSGEVLTHVGSTVDMDTTPIVYYGVNTTGFDTTATYDVNGEVSWGVVKQIYDGFPSYIPKDPGTFVDFASIPIALEQSGNYNGTPPAS